MFKISNRKLFLKKSYLKARKNLLWPLLFLKKIQDISKEEIRNILFLRHDRIGDMVLSTAALRSLKKAYPEARITVLASERNQEILTHNPHVDEILIYQGILWFMKTIRPRGYDLVIDPFLTYELKQAFMTYLAGGKYRIGFEKAGREIFFNLRSPTVLPPKRMVNHLLDLVGAVGGESAGCVPEVFLSDNELQWASQTLAAKGIKPEELTIAIHPGAYYPSQRWPAERFGALIKRIIEHLRAQVILLGSPDEKELVKVVQEKLKVRKGVQDFSGYRLRELMALLSRCDLLVCNNSGPLHIASALEVPTVSMIGPTVTPLWLPYVEHDMVIHKKLPCSPCNRAVCEDHTCMETIMVDEVFEAVQSQIARLRTRRKESVAAQKRISS
jgi:lipopolysaccharide heptosyltransferase II